MKIGQFRWVAVSFHGLLIEFKLQTSVSTAIQSDGELYVPFKVIDPFPTDAHWVNPRTAARVDWCTCSMLFKLKNA